jgi:hypothetical protein
MRFIGKALLDRRHVVLGLLELHLAREGGREGGRARTEFF